MLTLNLKSEITNHCYSFRFNFDKLTLEMIAMFPDLKMFGNYDMRAKVSSMFENLQYFLKKILEKKFSLSTGYCWPRRFEGVYDKYESESENWCK